MIDFFIEFEKVLKRIGDETAKALKEGYNGYDVSMKEPTEAPVAQCELIKLFVARVTVRASAELVGV